MNLSPLSQLNGVPRAEITDLTADGCRVARSDRPYPDGRSRLRAGMPVHHHGDNGEMTGYSCSTPASRQDERAAHASHDGIGEFCAVEKSDDADEDTHYDEIDAHSWHVPSDAATASFASQRPSSNARSAFASSSWSFDIPHRTLTSYIVGHKYVIVLVDVQGHGSRRSRNNHRSSGITRVRQY